MSFAVGLETKDLDDIIVALKDSHSHQTVYEYAFEQ